MTDQPAVKIGDWIIIGDPSTRHCSDGLVMHVADDYISVGYYQNKIKAVKEDFTWNGRYWDFLIQTVDSSYLHSQDEAAVKRGKPRIP